jgi:hypothetical protein
MIDFMQDFTSVLDAFNSKINNSHATTRLNNLQYKYKLHRS